jgi:hypothetical protein
MILFWNLYYSYGREFAEPYLGHSIGPVAGYGVREKPFISSQLLSNFKKYFCLIKRSRIEALLTIVSHLIEHKKIKFQ